MAKNIDVQDNPAIKTDGTIECGGYTIDPSQSLPQYNIGSALAYQAQTKAGNKMLALVQSDDLPFRINNAKILIRDPCNNMLRLYHEQAVTWLDGTNKRVAIQQFPAIPKLLSSLHDKRKPIPHTVIMNILIEPFGQLFNYMRHRRLYHGFIRPDNIYWDGSETSAMIFGPTHTGPALYYQDYRFLELNNSLCEPVLRGEGDLDDDLYAFGITLMSALLGYVPANDLSPHELLEEKILRGSYACYAQNVKFRDNIAELLKGILHDNIEKRWDEDEFSEWLLGRKQSPQQQFLPRRANEPIIIDDRKCYTLQELYILHHNHWETIANTVETDQLSMWIRKNFSDLPIYNSIRNLFSKMDKNNNKDTLAAMILMHIWPEAGAIYKGKNFFPDGIILYMGIHAEDNKVIKFVHEVYETNIVQFWAELLPTKMKKRSRYVTRYNNFMETLNNKSIGWGLSRAIYDNLYGMNCKSPILLDENVVMPQEILPTFEKLASQKKLRPSDILIDHHVAGFIMAHTVNKPTGDISKFDDRRVRLDGKLKAQLSILTSLAREYHREQKFPFLTKYMVLSLNAVIDKCYANSTKRKLNKSLLMAGKKGDLNALLRIINDQALIIEDTKRFLTAQDEYNHLCLETRQQFMNLANIKQRSAQTGGELSMVVSGIGSAAISVIIFLIQLLI